MKKTGLILFITLAFPFFTCAEEIGRKEGVFAQWQKSLEENKIPGLPVFFANKINSHWIGFGFLLNSPESFDQESPFRSLMQQFPFFQAAVLLQGKGISSSIVFSYERNDIWGVNAKFSF